jgi:hypothetical protein
MRPPPQPARRRLVAAPTLALAAAGIALGSTGCPRRQGTPASVDASVAGAELRDVRCVERPEGCVFCEGRGTPPPLLEPDEPASSLCDPKDDANCVDFCSRLAPECATPWRRGQSCLLPSEEEFRREIFRRDTADRPEVTLQGRVLDDTGRRIEAAKVRVWFQGTAIADEMSGKDGGFKVRLRSAATPYTVRISHPGHATEIADVKLDRPPAVTRGFHLGPESTLRGRVVDAGAAPVPGVPVPGVIIRALRSPDDQIEVSSGITGDDGQFVVSGLDSKRYALLASRFGWLPGSARATAGPGAPRVPIRLARTGVIRGTVVDGDGDPQPNAVVVAMLSGAFGVASSPVVWTTDTAGKFAQDRFQPGTYYLWARHGETLVYPPEKIELGEGHHDVETELALEHRGARVRGRVAVTTSAPAAAVPDSERRAVLVGRSPLAFPRKAVGDVDPRNGAFTIAGVLPGRYELSIRVGGKVLPITSGPREVEVPIEEGATVDLSDPVTVRPKPDD